MKFQILLGFLLCSKKTFSLFGQSSNGIYKPLLEANSEEDIDTTRILKRISSGSKDEKIGYIPQTSAHAHGEVKSFLKIPRDFFRSKGSSSQATSASSSEKEIDLNLKEFGKRVWNHLDLEEKTNWTRTKTYYVKLTNNHCSIESLMKQDRTMCSYMTTGSMRVRDLEEKSEFWGHDYIKIQSDQLLQVRKMVDTSGSTHNSPIRESLFEALLYIYKRSETREQLRKRLITKSFLEYAGAYAMTVSQPQKNEDLPEINENYIVTPTIDTLSNHWRLSRISNLIEDVCGEKYQRALAFYVLKAAHSALQANFSSRHDHQPLFDFDGLFSRDELLRQVEDYNKKTLQAIESGLSIKSIGSLPLEATIQTLANFFVRPPRLPRHEVYHTRQFALVFEILEFIQGSVIKDAFENVRVDLNFWQKRELIRHLHKAQLFLYEARSYAQYITRLRGVPSKIPESIWNMAEDGKNLSLHKDQVRALLQTVPTAASSWLENPMVSEFISMSETVFHLSPQEKLFHYQKRKHFIPPKLIIEEENEEVSFH